MEQITQINPERIAWCCADYGTTPSELAAELGIAASTMDRVMSGEGGLSFTQLSKIAKHLGRGVLFFLEPGPVDAERVHTAQFRTLANQKPALSPGIRKLIERVENQREVYLSLLEDLEDTERQQFAPPDLPHRNPQAAAAMARPWMALPDRNNFDSYRSAVESRGILVFRSNGYNGPWQIPKESPILGLTLYDPVCPVIVVRKQSSETRQSFSLMHELGHLLLHRTSSIDDEEDFLSREGREHTANAFAGHLLVPDAFLNDIRDTDRPESVAEYDNWLSPQSKAWGVSREVILRRLLDAGRLEQRAYAAYRQWRAALPVSRAETGFREYRYREPRHVFGDMFVQTVLDALNTRQITLARASSYLDNLKIRDLHKLEGLYAGF
jgi:Zn-dependent peptidase ImmA (M78 family)